MSSQGGGPSRPSDSPGGAPQRQEGYTSSLLRYPLGKATHKVPLLRPLLCMDLSDLTIQPGKVHLIREILHDGVTGSVRVLGSLESYDAAADAAVIGYKGHQLVVGTSLLTDFQFRIASLYEFIGEIEDGPRGKRVKARVCRNVDGLDTHLFEKALEVRRAFLADPAYQGGGPASAP